MKRAGSKKEIAARSLRNLESLSFEDDRFLIDNEICEISGAVDVFNGVAGWLAGAVGGGYKYTANRALPSYGTGATFGGALVATCAGGHRGALAGASGVCIGMVGGAIIGLAGNYIYAVSIGRINFRPELR